MVVVF
jgi:hypothetical protein